MTDLKWCYLGLTEYHIGMKVMEHLRLEVKENPKVQYLLLLQHPPVITQGPSDRGDSSLRISREELARQGIPVVSSDRGGKTTFHGPGQLVGYTIFHLDTLGLKLKQFVHLLEETVIQLLDTYGITATLQPGEQGVWLNNLKVAFLGLHVKDQVVTHGFAINVNTDLSLYSNLIACGLEAESITSMQKVLGHDLSLFDVYWRLVLILSDLFHLTPEEVYIDEVDWFV